VPGPLAERHLTARHYNVYGDHGLAADHQARSALSPPQRPAGADPDSARIQSPARLVRETGKPITQVAARISALLRAL
jgi:hypothetical protein